MYTYNKKSVPNTKPCKFCGSTNTKLRKVTNRQSNRFGTMYSIGCGTCYAKGPVVTDRFDKDPEGCISKAIDKWNEEYKEN